LRHTTPLHFKSFRLARAKLTPQYTARLKEYQEFTKIVLIIQEYWGYLVARMARRAISTNWFAIFIIKQAVHKQMPHTGHGSASLSFAPIVRDSLEKRGESSPRDIAAPTGHISFIMQFF
jgi:hypothetical protein